MKHIATLSITACTLILPAITNAQCAAGEVEVRMEVTTDLYGYETYWQLVPGGNVCGTATIAEGGNLTMDCGSGGLQLQDTTGYADTTTYTEGPWCLTEGAIYTVFTLDDWGDGQASYKVFVNDTVVMQYNEAGPAHSFDFSSLVTYRDLAVTELTTALCSHEGDAVTVRGVIRSFGVDVVNQFDLNYTIDGGSPVTSTVNVTGMIAGDSYEFAHATPWNASGMGTHSLQVWATNINGGADEITANDALTSDLKVSAAIPNILDQLLWGTAAIDVVANSNEDLLVPRDLDFHPDPARNELWVVNKDTEASGSSTVKFTAPGEAGQTFLMQEDPNNWHFMSLATGLALGDNGNFCTSPGVYDANHGAGTPFTGPSLWSGDPAIYAQPIFGGLGSHLDMLHESPRSQGVASQYWNRYWVVDGWNGDVVMYDFKKDHGPGNDYHGNGVVHRYDDDQITRDPAEHVVSHCAFDKNSGWLYVVDFGGQRVFRINTNTGTLGGPGDYGPMEAMAEYRMVTGYTQEELVTTGLVQPAGIDVFGDRMIVSDHSNGDIIIYDVSSAPAVEVGRIHTLVPGIMGVVIGPDGTIWYVNATTSELVHVSLDLTTANVPNTDAQPWAVVPNPASDQVWITGGRIVPGTAFTVSDAAGRVVIRSSTALTSTGIDVSGLACGTYALRVADRSQALVIQR